MRVLVAGATGALGRPALRALRRDGHDVMGTTRSRSRAAGVEDLGATPVIVDAMDREAIVRAVAEARPEVVVDLLTALPAAGPWRASDMRATNATRRVGSGNLLEAAIGAGARRYLAESFFLVYGSGDLGTQPLGEDRAVPVRVAHPALKETIDAMLTKERRALEAARQGRIEAAVLRFGGFYGPGAGLEELVDLLRRRRLPVVNSRHATPWIEIDDAAEAVAAAVMRARPGAVYNIVDDEPLPMAVLFRALAEAAHAPRPVAVPGFLFQLFAPYLKAVLIDTSVRLSNARARSELGWSPRYPRSTEAVAALVA